MSYERLCWTQKIRNLKKFYNDALCGRVRSCFEQGPSSSQMGFQSGCKRGLVKRKIAETPFKTLHFFIKINKFGFGLAVLNFFDNFELDLFLICF